MAMGFRVKEFTRSIGLLWTTQPAAATALEAKPSPNPKPPDPKS